MDFSSIQILNYTDKSNKFIYSGKQQHHTQDSNATQSIHGSRSMFHFSGVTIFCPVEAEIGSSSLIMTAAPCRAV